MNPSRRSFLLALLVYVAAAPSLAQDSAPVRVATLLPFVEDALTLASEQAEVVASVRRSMHSPLRSGLVDLGNPHSPNFERLAEARPDLIVGDRQIHGALAKSFEATGAKLLLIDTSGTDAVLKALLEVSRAVGHSDSLEQQVAQVRSEIETLHSNRAVSVLPLFGAPGSFYAITDRAWLGQLLAELGFENLAPSRGDERFPGLVVVSDEVLSTLQPDLVVLVAHGDPKKIRASLAQRTADGGAWSSLGAARLGVHVLDPRLFSANPGLELGSAARALVALSEKTL